MPRGVPNKEKEISDPQPGGAVERLIQAQLQAESVQAGNFSRVHHVVRRLGSKFEQRADGSETWTVQMVDDYISSYLSDGWTIIRAQVSNWSPQGVDLFYLLAK